MVRFANANPWENAGFDVKEKFKSVSDVMKDAGLDYNVSLQDAFLENGTRIPKCKVTVRDDNSKVLGVVGERYQVLNNNDSFAWFQEFIDNKVATIEHAGQLPKSNIVFVQANINIDPIEITKGDAVESRITLLNSFDGSTSVFAGFFPHRIFCNNQLPKLKSSNMLRIKHTKNLHLGLDKIKQIMNVHRQEFIATAEQYKYLASKGVSKKTLEKYVTLIFGDEETPEKEIRKSKIETIEQLFVEGRGASNKTGNFYGAFNAVNEYLNYEAGRSMESRLKSLWLGTNALINQKSLDIALELAK